MDCQQRPQTDSTREETGLQWAAFYVKELTSLTVSPRRTWARSHPYTSFTLRLNQRQAVTSGVQVYEFSLTVQRKTDNKQVTIAKGLAGWFLFISFQTQTLFPIFYQCKREEG